METEDVAGAENFKRFEQEGWSRPGKAALYAGNFARLTEPFIGVILDQAGIERGARVLDFGCGPGNLAAEVARRGAVVVGADASPDMVALAARHHPDIQFRIADAEEPDFEAGSFDVVLAHFLLHSLARPRRALAALAKLLRPGGRLATSHWIFAPRPFLTPQAAFLGAVADLEVHPVHPIPEGPDLAAFDDPAGFAALLTAAGFADVSSEEVTLPVVLTGDEVWDAFSLGAVRSAALVEGQPEETVRALRRALERRLELARTGGGYRLSLIARIATAVHA
jgi:2-polyprenyl-3-methyl-5-hydroxy-6-metoxy-1,4-benzoquinol methylase